MEVFLMSEVGENIIIATFKDMREFCKQVSLLLSTAETAILKAGWELAQTKNPATRSWNGIGDPIYWIPFYMFRFYKHKKINNILCFVSVLLDLKNNAAGVPLVSAGWFRFEGKDIGDWRFEYCTNHLCHPEADLEGHWMEARHPKNGWVKEHKIDFFWSMALPLEKITNTDELQKRVISELLESVRGKVGRDA
jgi:hypothetical protein